MQYSYNDGLRNAGRTPKLWIVHRGKIYTFGGEAIPRRRGGDEHRLREKREVVEHDVRP